MNLRGRIYTDPNTGVMYVSATSFQDVARCPFRGYLSKVLQIAPRGGVESAALSYGSAFHEVMQKFLEFGEIIDFQEAWYPYKDKLLYYNEQESNYETLLLKGRLTTEMAIKHLLAMNIGRPYKVDNKATVEVPNTIEISKTLRLARTYDAILPVKDIPTVLDFKTSAKAYTPGLQEDISEQLTAYLIPHTLVGVPQPKQAMFFVVTKAASVRIETYPTIRSKRRIKLFMEDLKMVEKVIRSKQVYRCRSAENCGSASRPRCEYRPLCYGDNKSVIKDYIRLT